MNTPYNPYAPMQGRASGRTSRRGCRGCVRGCLTLLAVIVVGVVLLAVVLRFVPIPFQVFLNPLPYYFQYTHLVHHGQTHVYRVAWSPDGKEMASVSNARTVQVWTVAGDRTLFTYQAPATSAMIPLSWSPNGKWLALADTGHRVLVLNASHGQTLFTVPNTTSASGSISWSPDSTDIAAINQGGHIQVWNIATGQTVLTISSDRADEVAWSSNGAFLASTSQNGSMHIWNAMTGQLLDIQSAQSKYDQTSSPIWSADSTNLAFLVTTLENERVDVWNVATHRQVFTWTLAKNRVNRLLMAWSPKSKLLAIAGKLDSSIEIWNIPTNRQVVSYSGHSTADYLFGRRSSAGNTAITSLAWSPDGTRLISADNADSAQIWEAGHGKTLFVLYGADNSFYYRPFGGIDDVAWSPNGTRVVLGCGEDAEIWQPA